MITQTELKERLEYNPDTGVFTRLVLTGRFSKGTFAGTKSHGYIDIGFLGKRYGAHRLAWLYVHGHFPEQIDHINGIRDDNRLSNLREVNNYINSRNIGMRKNNKSGFMGVSWANRDSKWVSQIMINYKTIILGTFDDKEDAIEARKAANIKYGFHVNHGERVGFPKSQKR